MTLVRQYWDCQKWIGITTHSTRNYQLHLSTQKPLLTLSNKILNWLVVFMISVVLCEEEIVIDNVTPCSNMDYKSYSVKRKQICAIYNSLRTIGVLPDIGAVC